MRWEDLQDRIDSLVQQNLKAASIARNYLGKLPPIDAELWVDGEHDWAQLKVSEDSTPADRKPWIKLAREVAQEVVWGHEDPDYPDSLVKLAYSKTLRNITDTLNLTPGKMFGHIPNKPSPLAASLTGGVLGAGLGYGAGALAEKLLPENWERGKLRRTLALLGGGIGASPGALWGAFSLGNAQAPWSSWPYKPGDEIPTDSALDIKDIETPMYYPRKAGMAMETLQEINDTLAKELPATEILHIAKNAFAENPMPGFSTFGVGVPPVPVDAFNRVIWGDPRVANRLDTPTQAAASAMMASASRMGMPGLQQSAFVTPGQVGALAMGMGSGYLSGAIVGKALGALMGMPSGTQERLKNTGMWAGAVQALVPQLFH
jgi:hypothetical protein